MTTRTIKTKMGQASHVGKWWPAAQMVRLVRELQLKLEEAGLLAPDDKSAIDNVVICFLASVPKKVSDEVREG